MSATETPVVLEYQRALEEFRRASGAQGPFLKRMSELISLLDLTTTLSSSLSGQEILDAALLIVMGELQCSRGCILVRKPDGQYAVRASRGLPIERDAEFSLSPWPEGEMVLAGAGQGPEVIQALGMEVLCPILRSGRFVAVLGLGPRAQDREFGSGELAFLRSVAACAATPIENGLIHEELQQLNKRLSMKVFQLHGLFDISRELTASLDEEVIAGLLTTTLMGQLLVSRCGLFLWGSEGLRLAHSRGIKMEEGPRLGGAGVPELLTALKGPTPVGALPEGELRQLLASQRLGLLVPMRSGERAIGFVALAERISGAFSEEDQDFAQTLARQAMAALEAARLHRLRVEKQRRDRELQIAREIQQSLFPRSWPTIPGFQVAARSEACHEVGGDHYDVIPLDQGRLAITIADVSGKGTPASLLMASVHAWLRALAGTTSPPVFMERLNQFLYASTQANKYVTLFYGELEPSSGRLVFVNGGHVPPFLARADGRRERLEAGGTALGLLEEGRYEAGAISLQAGDALVMVTDGATEALSTTEEEFGDERVFDTVCIARGQSAEGILDRLVGAVHDWTGAAGCTDDLTALVLKAQQEL